MTHCPSFEELIALIDGELVSERELEIRWHLDVCVACTRLANGVVALKQVVGRSHDREVPSPALRRSVMGRVAKRKRNRQWRVGVVAAPLFITGAVLFCVGPSVAGVNAGCTQRDGVQLATAGEHHHLRSEKQVPSESF